MGNKQLDDATPADVVKRLMKDGKLKRKCCRSKPRCRKCPVLALQRTKEVSRFTDSGHVLLTAAKPPKSKSDRVVPDKKLAKKLAKKAMKQTGKPIKLAKRAA